MEATPEAVVRGAIEQGAQIMVSTYNEPLITSEWAVAIFKAAKAAGFDDWIRVQRQRYAAGPRVSPAMGRLVQSGPQEL